MNKAELRNKYFELRKDLDESTIESSSLEIANQCLKLPIWDKTSFHIFLSMPQKKEVDTTFLLHILHGRDKTIAVPKTNFKDCSMQAILLQENTKLQMTNFGVPEPESGISLPPNSFDVIFVPLLAYDKKGNRLGYGKGFYDRFLSQCKSECLFIGLSYFPPEDAIPVSENDIPLDYCVTPDSLYRF